MGCCHGADLALPLMSCMTPENEGTMSSSSHTWCAQGTKQQFMKVSLWRFST